MLDLATVRLICLDVLQSHGWTPMDSVSIAEKEFETAVGVKVADVYLYDNDGFNYTLRGNYQSEGRNAMPYGTLIPINADENAVRDLVQAFCQYAKEAIDGSYARGLFLKRTTATVQAAFA
jgi:hypothetical protein